MKIKNKLLLAIWLFSINLLAAKAQNLVPNPSFELYNQLPCGMITTQIAFAAALQNWTLPSRGTADIFSTKIDPSCWAYPFGDSYFDMKKGKTAFGVQPPRTGSVMTGIATYLENRDYREYLQVKLLKPLQKGLYYKVSFWVAQASAVYFAANNLGFCLLKDSVLVAHDKPLKLKPDFAAEQVIETKFLEWYEITAIIEAKEEVYYLVIGNFANNKSTTVTYIESPMHESWDKSLQNAAYYFIDDVSVQEETEEEFAGFRKRKNR
jgi:hypothetical protein